MTAAQLAFVYQPAAAGAEAWEVEIEALRDAVAHLGMKEVVDQLDVNRTLLCDSMNGRDRKRWAGEWTPVIIQMLVRKADEAAHELVRRILAAPATGTSFVIEENDITDAEVAAAQRIVDAAKRRKNGARVMPRRP